MPGPDRHAALARRWMSKARTDLALATVVLEQGPEMEAWVACFHAQQAAEKAIQAILVAREASSPRSSTTSLPFAHFCPAKSTLTFLSRVSATSAPTRVASAT